MLKSKIYTLLIFCSVFWLLLNGCSSENNNSVKEEQKVTKDTIVESEVMHAKSDSLAKEVEVIHVLSPEGEFSYHFENVINPVVFTKEGIVYEKKDTNSTVLKKLTFNTGLIVTALDDEIWLEIDLGTKKGYIQRKQIAAFSFSGASNSTKKYFIVEQIPSEENNWENLFTMYTYDWSTKKMVDSLSSDSIRLDKIHVLDHSKWENMDLLLMIEETNPFCGGVQKQMYIAVVEEKLQALFFTSSWIDDGGGGEVSSWVFLPQYPEKDTIRYYDYITEAMYDKNENLMLDADGHTKLKVIKDITILYRWNGKRLIRVN